MQHLEVSVAVRPLIWSLGVKWVICVSDSLRAVTLLVLFDCEDKGTGIFRNVGNTLPEYTS